MARNVKEFYDAADAYYVRYPTQPGYDPNCAVNQDYDTLPNTWPRHHTVLGPATLKKLYTGVPNYYPPQGLSVPIGTMYDIDTGKFAPDGRRVSYGAQFYPFSNRMIREIRPYSGETLPVPQLFQMTHYHTVKEGTWGR